MPLQPNIQLCTPTTLHENVINVNSSWARKKYTKVQVKVLSSAVSWRLMFYATRVESDFLALLQVYGINTTN